MEKYKIVLSKQARIDLKDIANFIANTYKAPETARRYAAGIVKEISELSKHAGSIQISEHKTILQYGQNARRVTFKKTTIIYTIHSKTVLVEKIMISSLITE